MGIKSSYVSGRWPGMAIAGDMQDDDCLAFHEDDGRLRDGTRFAVTQRPSTRRWLWCRAAGG